MSSRAILLISLISDVALALRIAREPELIVPPESNKLDFMDGDKLLAKLQSSPFDDDAILQYAMSEFNGLVHNSVSGFGNPLGEDLKSEIHGIRGPSNYEFGWESSVMVPHAYALVKAGLVDRTRSCGDLSALYWFSPKHENLNCLRDRLIWSEWHGIRRTVLMSYVPDSRIPNWLPPPHKEHYSTFPALPGLFQSGVERSIMVVNKYTFEWGRPSVNYFSEEMLDWMSTSIQDKCADTQMVYERNRMLNKDKSTATDELSGLQDFELLAGRERVVMMEDVLDNSTSSNISFNEANMRAMAKHSCFASVQGGLMAFVAQFGGKHIVLHREGRETDAFYRRLGRMGKGNIFVVRGTEKDNGEDEFKKVFEREFLSDGCRSCQL